MWLIVNLPSSEIIVLAETNGEKPAKFSVRRFTAVASRREVAIRRFVINHASGWRTPQWNSVSIHRHRDDHRPLAPTTSIISPHYVISECMTSYSVHANAVIHRWRWTWRCIAVGVNKQASKGTAKARIRSHDASLNPKRKCFQLPLNCPYSWCPAVSKTWLFHTRGRQQRISCRRSDVSRPVSLCLSNE